MKKLYRSKSNQMLCGVCAGIGEYTNVDANVIRLIFAAAAFAGGISVVVYILAIFILPDSDNWMIVFYYIIDFLQNFAKKVLTKLNIYGLIEVRKRWE